VLAAAVAVEFVCLISIVIHAGLPHSWMVPGGHGNPPLWIRGLIPPSGGVLRHETFVRTLLLMCGAYAVVVALAGRVRARWPFVAAVAAIAIATLAPPLLSSDVFGYIAWARMGVRGLNPYTHPPVAIGHADPAFVPGLWHHGATPYGPLFTFASYALAPLPVPVALWTLKALAGASAIGCVELLRRAARRLGRPPVRAALVFGLNPLLVVWGVGGGHNDLLLGLVVSAAVLAFLNGHERAGAAGIVAAGALKVVGFAALPFMLVRASRTRALRPALVGTALAALAVALVGAVAFGAPLLRIGNTFGFQQSLVSLHSGPAELARVLGLSHPPRAMRTIAALLVVAVAAVGLLRVRAGGDWIAATGWTLVALLLATAWLLPWYVAWALPFVALADDRRLDAVTVLLTLGIVASRLQELS
jgi:hypothetical protein